MSDSLSALPSMGNQPARIATSSRTDALSNTALLLMALDRVRPEEVPDIPEDIFDRVRDVAVTSLLEQTSLLLGIGALRVLLLTRFMVEDYLESDHSIAAKIQGPVPAIMRGALHTYRVGYADRTKTSDFVSMMDALKEAGYEPGTDPAEGDA